MSFASFYDDGGVLINVEELREDFKLTYIHNGRKANKSFHPAMKRMGDKECDGNDVIEVAKIAPVSQIRECMQGSCGDDPLTGAGCRFDFPKRKQAKAVVGIIRIDQQQCEARVVIERTKHAVRINNFNRFIALFWRGNHYCTMLIDSAHSIRYCTKYASKNTKHSHMYVEMLEELSSRGIENLPINTRELLDRVFLGNAGHRSFMSITEVAYRTLGLPLVMKSFNIAVEGSYWRAKIITLNYGVQVYSDRTQYSAYAERFEADVQHIKSGLTKEELCAMNLRDFNESVSGIFMKHKHSNLPKTPLTNRGQLRSCVVGTEHWMYSKRPCRRHVRFSTIAISDLAVNYEPIDLETDTAPNTFHELPYE